MQTVLKQGPRVRFRRPTETDEGEVPAHFWVGINIARTRHRMKLTQAQLAKAAKVSVRNLYDIERVAPLANPTLGTLEGLAAALKTTVRELMRPNTVKVPKV